MNDASSTLLKLRPVTFHYKADRQSANRAVHYGLIAEEVAEVLPELVAHSAGGQVETVMYQYLAPMLVNEYQKQQRVVAAQTRRIAAIERDRGALAAEVTELRNERIVHAQELAELRRSVGILLARSQAGANFASTR